MRAKDYLIIHEQEIKYLDEIKQVLSDLSLIRNNETLTEEYFENILNTDKRFYNWEIEHKEWLSVFHQYGDTYDEKGSYTNEPQYIININEINKDIASYFRKQLFDIVKEDNSFGHIFLLLANEQGKSSNIKHPSKDEIKDAIYEDMFLQQKEDEKQIKGLQQQLKESINELNNLKNEKHVIFTSNIHLSNEKNTQIDFIRVINCLYELKFFQSTDIEKDILKKEVFNVFGKAINKDLSTFSQQLTTTKKSANQDNIATRRIFEKMLDQQQ